MKQSIQLITVAALCAFSTLALADAKTDFINANAACFAAYQLDGNSPALHQCTQDAWAAFQATRTGQAVMQRAVAKAKKK